MLTVEKCQRARHTGAVGPPVNVRLVAYEGRFIWHFGTESKDGITMVITLHPTVITCNYGNNNLRSNITIENLPFGAREEVPDPKNDFQCQCYKKIVQLS